MQNIVTGQGDDYTTKCFLDYPYFKENYKLVTIDLSKQQVLNNDPSDTALNFIGNLERAWEYNSVLHS